MVVSAQAVFIRFMPGVCGRNRSEATAKPNAATLLLVRFGTTVLPICLFSMQKKEKNHSLFLKGFLLFMRKSMWGPFQKERSLKGWIVSAMALLLVLGALTGGLFVFSSRGPLSAHAQTVTGGGWLPTGSLPAARADHTATMLPNGKVLVAG